MIGVRPRRHHVRFSTSLGVDGEGTPYRAVWSENSSDQYRGSKKIVVLFGDAPWDTDFFAIDAYRTQLILGLTAIKTPWRLSPPGI